MPPMTADRAVLVERSMVAERVKPAAPVIVYVALLTVTPGAKSRLRPIDAPSVSPGADSEEAGLGPEQAAATNKAPVTGMTRQLRRRNLITVSSPAPH